MIRIHCDVEECSHNKDRACYANCVDIVGSSARQDYDTACGSFLNKLHYSDLTNNTVSHGACDCLTCSVETCAFHENNLCALEAIQVNAGAAEYYSQTRCASFECKREE